MLHHNWSLYLFHSELKYNSRTDSLTANMFIKSQCFRLMDFFPRKQRISLYSSMQTHIHAHPYCLLSIIQSELNGLQAYNLFYLLQKHSHRSKMEQWLNWSIQTSHVQHKQNSKYATQNLCISHPNKYISC